MSIVRPRLNDFFGLPFTQEEVDFAIPFLDEDIPLYIDPFLLWKSPSLQDNALHTSVVNSFNFLGSEFLKGREADSVRMLDAISECNEVGLGGAKNRVGKRMGPKLAGEVLSLFKNIPQVNAAGFVHFEEIQLLVNNVGRDRVSDITASLIKSFLIDFTIDQCEKLRVPTERVSVSVYDYKTHRLTDEETFLPQNPHTKQPIIFVPKRWLRYVPYINFDEYFQKQFVGDADQLPSRVEVLQFNRQNYDAVRAYVQSKERQQSDCKNDPLFKQIPVRSAKGKLSTVLKLPTGKTDAADRKYEDTLCPLLASLLYPHMDFAQEQSRTDSGMLIRDLIFYNNRSYDFLKDVYDEYECRQIVVELKNVAKVDREHVNQLNRYLTGQFGRFGILFTRKGPPRNIYQNTIDLWSGQRRCILIMTDEDLSLMCEVYESKNRNPIDVIKKKYVEFTRSLPS
jgi:hypothetical protein